MPMSTVDNAVAALSCGRMVIISDSADRENEFDLVIGAEYATRDIVAFFLAHTSGFLCTAITEGRAKDLELGFMTSKSTDRHGTAFLVSVDSKYGTTTGISALDRATTIKSLSDPGIGAAGFLRPGHVLPLQARKGGVLERPGHTEASVDLCHLAGLRSAALLCELVTEDRRGMMRRGEAEEFAASHDIPVVSIADISRQLWRDNMPVERVSCARVPMPEGEFEAICYRSSDSGVEHLALVLGDISDKDGVLVRVHSECVTGDLFHSRRCDCGIQLRTALKQISNAGVGVLVYVRDHEGRGIGLAQKLRAYKLQDERGLDTVDANIELGLPVEMRQYRVAAAIISDLGVRRMRLMTNNPEKCRGLAEHGDFAVECVPLEAPPNIHNAAYLNTKRERLGHRLTIDYGSSASCRDYESAKGE